MTLPNLKPPPERAGAIRVLGATLVRAVDAHGAADAVEHVFSGKPLPADAFTAALGADVMDTLVDLGLVERHGGLARSLFAARVVGGRVLFTDLPRKAFQGEPLYVDPLWEAPAFARMLVASRMRMGLDMGCGCGVLAIAMSEHCETVYATDINPRALEIARFNAQLNGADNIVFVQSSLFDDLEPSLRFDQIVFNAPVGREFAARHMLEAGEEILEAFFTALPARLNPDGVAQVNMCIKDWRGETFFERMRRWIGPSAAGFQHLFMQLWREESGPRFLMYRLMGTLRTGRNCLACTGVARGWLTLRRKPGLPSWVLPTNYHMWVHDAPEMSAGRIIIAAMDAGFGDEDADHGLAAPASLRPVDTRRRGASSPTVLHRIRRHRMKLGASLVLLTTFVAFALASE